MRKAEALKVHQPKLHTGVSGTGPTTSAKTKKGTAVADSKTPETRFEKRGPDVLGKITDYDRRTRATLHGSEAPKMVAVAPSASKIKGDTRDANGLAFGLLDGTKTPEDLFKALRISMNA